MMSRVNHVNPEEDNNAISVILDNPGMNKDDPENHDFMT